MLDTTTFASPNKIKRILFIIFDTLFLFFHCDYKDVNVQPSHISEKMMFKELVLGILISFTAIYHEREFVLN